MLENMGIFSRKERKDAAVRAPWAPSSPRLTAPLKRLAAHEAELNELLGDAETQPVPVTLELVTTPDGKYAGALAITARHRETVIGEVPAQFGESHPAFFGMVIGGGVREAVAVIGRSDGRLWVQLKI